MILIVLKSCCIKRGPKVVPCRDHSKFNVIGPRYTIRYSAGYSIRYSFLDYLMEYLIVYRTKNNTSDIQKRLENI